VKNYKKETVKSHKMKKNYENFEHNMILSLKENKKKNLKIKGLQNEFKKFKNLYLKLEKKKNKEVQLSPEERESAELLKILKRFYLFKKSRTIKSKFCK